MKKRFLIALPIAGLAIWLLRDEPAEAPAPQQVVVADAPAASPRRAQRAAQTQVEAVPPAAPTAPVAPPAPEGPATVVATSPHDEVPSLPLADAPVPENDPIEPELEQTPAWRYEKTAHIAARLDRHLERLDGAVAIAEEAGKADEARRLRIMAERQRQRLEAIRLEASQLRTKLEEVEEVEISSAP